MILQADPALVGAQAPVRLERKFFRWHGLTFGVVRHLHAVHKHLGAGSLQADHHRVPLRPRLSGLGQRPGQGVKGAGHVIVVFVSALRMIVNLDLVSAVDRHPGFRRLARDANEDTGVVVLVLHPVHHADLAIVQRAASPIEEPHAPVGLQQFMLHGEAARPHVRPAFQIVAVEKLPRAELLGRRQRRAAPQNQQRQRPHLPHRFAPRPAENASLSGFTITVPDPM